MMHKKHWAHINELTFITGMRILLWIYNIFGCVPFLIVLYPVVMCYMIFCKSARAASKDYLKHIAEYNQNIKLNNLTILCHFISFAESILDKLLLWGDLFKLENIKYTGQENIINNIAKNIGGLFICSHLGNLELCRILSNKRSGLKLTVLIHNKHAKAFNQLLAKLNPASQFNLMQVTEISPATAIALINKVNQGEFIVIAGDRIPISLNPRVAIAPFLGQNAPFPIGPYVLASVLQCPVYLIFSVKIQNSVEIFIELFREAIILPRKNRDSLLSQLAADYAARLAYYCQQSPLQWFNFYDFWNIHENK
jgi:predicted LPLAT superfamily acyltransferase